MLAVAAIALALVTLPGFRSPSGNISCYYQPQGNLVHCDIAHADYAARLQDQCINPKGEMGAGVDWHGFELSAVGKGHVTCSGGALLTGSQHPRTTVLPYGHAWHAGMFTCVSRFTGVTCTRRGHGIFISRQRYRVF